MYRIALYINTFYGGGAERALSVLANQFSLEGFPVTVITTWRNEEDYFLEPGIERIVLREEDSRCKSSSTIIRNVYLIRNIRNILAARQINLLISFMGEPNIRNILATWGTSTKSIISVRTDPARAYSGFIGKLIAKRLLPKADGAVFQTKQQMVWFPEQLQKKSIVIPNPVNENFYSVKRKPVKHRIVTCGRLNAVKNHPMLIEATALLRERYPDIQLFIYGDGECRGPMEALIVEKQLSSVVYMMGQTSDVAKALSSADLFVLSSNYEGMPNALMEAMTVGVPCISTNCPCGGPRELIEDGKNGFLIPVGDSNALAEKISYVFDHPDEAEIAGKRAAEKMRDYTAEKIAERWENFLLPVCQNK